MRLRQVNKSTSLGRVEFAVDCEFRPELDGIAPDFPRVRMDASWHMAIPPFPPPHPWPCLAAGIPANKALSSRVVLDWKVGLDQRSWECLESPTVQHNPRRFRAPMRRRSSIACPQGATFALDGAESGGVYTTTTLKPTRNASPRLAN